MCSVWLGGVWYFTQNGCWSIDENAYFLCSGWPLFPLFLSSPGFGRIFIDSDETLIAIPRGRCWCISQPQPLFILTPLPISVSKCHSAPGNHCCLVRWVCLCTSEPVDVCVNYCKCCKGGGLDTFYCHWNCCVVCGSWEKIWSHFFGLRLHPSNNSKALAFST